MDYLIRHIQIHETFRKPEIQALADLQRLDIQFIAYSDTSPFTIIRLHPPRCHPTHARALISRSVLSKAIYQLWGSAPDYSTLHAAVRHFRAHAAPPPLYQTASFRFEVDCYQGKRSGAQQRALIEDFGYLGFVGEIRMHAPEEEFCIFEEWERGRRGIVEVPEPKRVAFGRLVGVGGRAAITKYDLKRRRYISTTSMDAELALVTANMALAGPGRLFYDPFVGTGSFAVACAHFGAVGMGSDIDGRSMRGKDTKGCGRLNLESNFQQYDLTGGWLDGFVADLTNSPIRIPRRRAQGRGRWLDGIVCDPPYGVREGLKVLGSKDSESKKTEVVWIDGKAAHLLPEYIPPKRPYSFLALLDDILDLAARVLVDDARLSMWMPTANEGLASTGEEPGIGEELNIPTHPCLEIVSVCIQPFNKWSRRLLTYRRLAGIELDHIDMAEWRERVPRGANRDGRNADDLNEFRRRYFEGFQPIIADSSRK